jgi:hypothetical protein
MDKQYCRINSRYTNKTKRTSKSGSYSKFCFMEVTQNEILVTHGISRENIEVALGRRR